MENINDYKTPKVIDLNETYIGLYENEKGLRIGLFKKSDKVNFERVNTSGAVQYYEDILSSNKVALWLNKNGEDIKSAYQPYENEPKEMVNWNGNCDRILSYEIDRYMLPPVNGSVDPHINLVQFTSVYPNLEGNISNEQIVEYLKDFCSKLALKEEALHQILVGLQAYILYCNDKKEELPQFVANIPINEIDMPKDLNMNKKIKL